MHASRIARVFVSSTFQDMQEERDILARSVFPRLRRRFRGDGIDLCEIDLRWGITREDAAERRVLPICLAEIDRSRPMFVALLGGRYGWVDPDAADAIGRAYPGLEPYRDRSVTELEIRHAVLNPPAAADGCRGYFYFRHDAESGDPRIAALAAELRRKFPQRCRDYRSPPDLAQFVEQDLGELLASCVRNEGALSRSQAARRELRLAHGAGTAAARPFVLNDLDRHLRAARPRVGLVGPAGSGKTALLAALIDRGARPSGGFWAWMRRGGASAPETVWFATAECALERALDWRDPVRELAAQLHERSPWPEDPRSLLAEPLLEATRRALVEFAALTPIIVVLDGLDELGEGAAGDYSWLRILLSASVGAIVACRPGPLEQTLRDLKFAIVEVPPMAAAGLHEAAGQYFAAYGKRLSDAQAAALAAGVGGYAGVLRLRLEELRLFGQFERLDAEIERLRGISDLETGVRYVFERVARDASLARSDAARDLVAFVAQSRCGLSDDELLALLGALRFDLGQRALSELTVALSALLAVRGGRVVLASPQVRRVVEGLGLPDLRDALAEHFARDPASRRALEELPALLVARQEWDRLIEYLCAPTVLAAFARWQPQEALALFGAAHQIRPQTCAAALRNALAQTAGEIGAARMAVQALIQLGESRAALDELSNLVGVVAADENWHELLAEALAACGDFARAGAVLAGLLERTPPDADAGRWLRTTRLAIHVDLEAGELPRAGERVRALRAFTERRGGAAERVYAGVQLGAIMTRIGQLDAARPLFEEARTFAERHGDAFLLHAAIGNLAVVARNRRRPREALRLHEKEQSLCRELADVPALIACLRNQSLACMDLGDYDGALTRLDEGLALASERRDAAAQIGVRVSQALLYRGLGQAAVARRLLEAARGDAAQLQHVPLQQEIDAALAALNAPL